MLSHNFNNKPYCLQSYIILEEYGVFNPDRRYLYIDNMFKKPVRGGAKTTSFNSIGNIFYHIIKARGIEEEYDVKNLYVEKIFDAPKEDVFSVKDELLKLSYNHYIVVDDSEIKEGDYYWNKNISNEIQYKKEKGILFHHCKKITYSTQPLERDYSQATYGIQYVEVFDKIKPISLSEVEELIHGYSVEKEAINDILQSVSPKTQWKVKFNEQNKLELV